jgi:hypothetical protein
MKTTFTILFLGVILCGCSKKHAASARDLVVASKDITWRNGVVLHVKQRDGASLTGVVIVSKLPTGQPQIVSADTATLSADTNATDDKSVMITLHNVWIQVGSTTRNSGEDYSMSLHE